MMVALAMPPPSHIVCSPYRPPRCSSALTRVVMMRAPLAPSGWPMAMAPPLTLVLARSAPGSHTTRMNPVPDMGDWSVKGQGEAAAATVVSAAASYWPGELLGVS